jgi:hypothetical protein
MGGRIINGDDDGYINYNKLEHHHIHRHANGDDDRYVDFYHMGYVNLNQYSHIRLHEMGYRYHNLHEHLLGDRHDDIYNNCYTNNYYYNNNKLPPR